MFQRGKQYVDDFQSLCRETNLDPSHVPTMRRILLHLSQGLIEANLLMDITTGCLLNKDEICASSAQIGKYAKTVKILDKGLEKETNQKASQEKYADLPCILDSTEQVKLEMLKQQCQQTKSPVVMFRKVVADRLGARLRGIHLFHWDGTPRASPQDIIFALCHYAPTQSGMSRAEKALGVAVAGAVGVGGYYALKKRPPQHPQAVSPQDFRLLPIRKQARTPEIPTQSKAQTQEIPTQAKAQKWFWQQDEDEIRTSDQFRDFLDRHKKKIVEKIGVKTMTHDEFMSLYKKPRNFYEIVNLLEEFLISNRKQLHKALTREIGTAVFIEVFQDDTCNTILNNQTFRVFMQKNNDEISKKMAKLTRDTFDAKYIENAPTGIQKLVEKFVWRLSTDVDKDQSISFANMLKKTYEKKFGTGLWSWW